MDCKMFSKDIHNFKNRPLLYNMLIRIHKEKNPNCKCKVKEVVI